MNNFSKILFAALALLALQACTNLEEDLVGDITEEINVPVSDQVDPGNADFFPTGDGPSSELGGAFSTLRTGSAGHGSYYAIQELTTDEMVIAAKGGDWFDGGVLIQLHQHTFTPTHGFIENACLLYTSPSPRDGLLSRMPSSA